MFRNPWIHFEATPDGGAVGGGAAAEPAAPAAEPAAEPFDAQQAIGELRESLSPLLDLAENLPGGIDPGGWPPQPAFAPEQAAQPQPAADPMPDPTYDPQGFQAWQERQWDAREQRIAQQYEPALQDAHMRHAQTQLEQAMGALEGDARTLGLPEEHHTQAQEAIEHLTAAFLPVDLADQVAQYPPAIAERIIEQQLSAAATSASAYLGELLTLAREQGRAEFRGSLGGEQGAGNGPPQPIEPGVGGGGIEGVKPAGSYEEIIHRHLGATPA